MIEPDLADESVQQLVGRLIGDAKDVAQAEVALAKARANAKISVWRSAAIWFALAGVVALCAMVALFVGAIFILTPLIGPGGAVLSVVLFGFVLAGIFGLIGKAKLG